MATGGTADLGDWIWGEEQLSASDVRLCSSCGGGICTAANGCSCSSDQTITCAPTNECSSVGTNICCPTGYYWSSTSNCCTASLTCNPSCLSNEICQNVSNIATCVCNTTVYSGLTTSSLSPSIQCAAATMTVSLNKCLLESLGYDTTSIRLDNSSDSCTNTFTQLINNVTILSIQALPQTGWCGNTISTDNVNINYSNVIHVGVQNKTIITASPINIPLSCSYNLTIQSSLAGGFNTALSSVNISVNGVGSVVSTMTAYSDAAYSIPIQSTDNVLVGSYVYIGIVSDAGDANKFVQRVESCFATPDNNVNNPNKVFLVSGGCPANQGVATDVQENGVSLQSRIRFNSFAFQGQTLVYLTCNLRMCDKNTTCTGCNVARSGEDSAQLQIPLNFLDSTLSSAPSTGSDREGQDCADDKVIKDTNSLLDKPALLSSHRQKSPPPPITSSCSAERRGHDWDIGV
ncbi:pancreatic secretory granule membrane major glycoprotein GP2-like [Gastrophryne carolinensis]